MSRLRRILLWGLSILIVVAAATAIAGWIYAERVRASLPTVTNLSDLRPDYGTTVQAQDGTHFGGAPTVEPVAYDALPPKLIATFLAAEDEDFFGHGGYNTRSILRAFFDNYRAGRSIQGASTVSQQVAKHFLHPGQTWRRKFRELLLAREIESRFGKTEILDAYLGGVYFGQQAWGVTQASYTYFSVPPDGLTTGQMATLAGLLPAPSVFNPIDNPDLALRERNRVLRRMHDVGLISADRVEELRAQPLEGPTPATRPNSPAPEAVGTVQRLWEDIGRGRTWEESDFEVVTSHHPGFQSLARQTLRQGIERHDRRLGYRGPPGRTDEPTAFDEALDELNEPKEGRLTLARVVELDDDALHLRVPGGDARVDAQDLDWVHGIDPRTERSLKPRADWREPFSIDDIVFVRPTQVGWQLWQWPIHEGAISLVDHHSGEVLASVGAYDVATSQFNRAEQACRQPGSLFKTILYTEALASGITLATLLSDVPTDITSRSGVWRPRNADRDFRGYLTVLDAFSASRNIPAVNLIQHLGFQRVIERARKMGVQSLLDPTPSLALGASCTGIGEMGDVHATIARGGLNHQRRPVTMVRDISSGAVRDHGHFLQRDPALLPRIARAAARPAPPDRAVERDVNFLMTHALRDVVTRGTAHEIPNEWPVAAKTGTSDEYDTWIAAFGPHMTTTIWVGSDRNTDPFAAGEHSGTVAVPIFTDLYEGLATERDSWPPEPPTDSRIDEILIDPQTGLRARPGQGGIRYPMVAGSAPHEYAPTRATRQLERFDSLLY